MAVLGGPRPWSTCSGPAPVVATMEISFLFCSPPSKIQIASKSMVLPVTFLTFVILFSSVSTWFQTYHFFTANRVPSGDKASSLSSSSAGRHLGHFHCVDSKKNVVLNILIPFFGDLSSLDYCKCVTQKHTHIAYNLPILIHILYKCRLIAFIPRDKIRSM